MAAKKRKSSTKKRARRKSAKKKQGRHRGRPISASAFIRSMSSDVPAKAVVEAGAKKGLKFSQQLVYNVRGAKGAKKAKRGVALKLGAAKRRQPDGADGQFRALVVELGISRSRQLLDDVSQAMQDAVA